MKISFIATVFNEEDTITQLLESLSLQSKLPDEIIIVDGGSIDATTSIISNFKFSILNKQIKPKITLIVKKGNRAVGRNDAVNYASGDIIACSDAGCILDKDWVKNITAPFIAKQTDVVAGYYSAKPKSVFEKCLVPYVLVMSDKVNPKDFLPASRSMAFKKSVWEKTGGFPEDFSHNEDYVWAQTLKKNGFNIAFTKDAIVHWIPRKNLKEVFIMFYLFAFGDIEAGIIRPKVFFLFARYIIGLLLIIISILTETNNLAFLLFLLFVLYLFWSINKNFKYVKKIQAILYLPIIQITADIAVIGGSAFALINKLWVIQKKR